MSSRSEHPLTSLRTPSPSRSGSPSTPEEPIDDTSEHDADVHNSELAEEEEHSLADTPEDTPEGEEDEDPFDILGDTFDLRNGLILNVPIFNVPAVLEPPRTGYMDDEAHKEHRSAYLEGLKRGEMDTEPTCCKSDHGTDTSDGGYDSDDSVWSRSTDSDKDEWGGNGKFCGYFDDIIVDVHKLFEGYERSEEGGEGEPQEQLNKYETQEALHDDAVGQREDAPRSLTPISGQVDDMAVDVHRPMEEGPQQEMYEDEARHSVDGLERRTPVSSGYSEIVPVVYRPFENEPQQSLVHDEPQQELQEDAPRQELHHQDPQQELHEHQPQQQPRENNIHPNDNTSVTLDPASNEADEEVHRLREESYDDILSDVHFMFEQEMGLFDSNSDSDGEVILTPTSSQDDTGPAQPDRPATPGSTGSSGSSNVPLNLPPELLASASAAQNRRAASAPAASSTTTAQDPDLLLVPRPLRPRRPRRKNVDHRDRCASWPASAYQQIAREVWRFVFKDNPPRDYDLFHEEFEELDDWI